MSSINFFNIYTLDFSCLHAFKEKIVSQDDALKSKLQEAIKAQTIRKDLENTKRMYELLSLPELAASKQINLCLENCSKSIQYTENLLKEYSGADPFEVQEVVHEILGIAQITDTQILDSTRKKYFESMKESGFLRTKYTSINHNEDQLSIYQPHLISGNFLKNHPEVQTLTIGCGVHGQTKIGSCYFRIPEDHQLQSYKIDISTEIGPDLIVNMHDCLFWQSIPNERFERVFDHTYGFFIFNDEQHSTNTLKELYRILKFGGYFKLDFPIEGPHAEQLTQLGFKIDSDNSKIARKV